jgi:hypothetical protein
MYMPVKTECVHVRRCAHACIHYATCDIHDIHTCVHIYTTIHKQLYTHYIHTYIHTHHKRTYTCTYTHQTHAYIHTLHTYTHTPHTHTYAYHTHTCAHTHHTNTHTHTYTPHQHISTHNFKHSHVNGIYNVHLVHTYRQTHILRLAK